MKTQTSKLILCLILFSCSLINVARAGDDFENLYADFQNAVANNDDTAALEKGDLLFEKISADYRADAGFGALKSKLMASEFLSQQMIQQLRKATGNQMRVMAGEILNKPVTGGNSSTQNADILAVAPAKSFYDTSIETFQKPINISSLTSDEIEFIRSYYNIKLRAFTSNVAKAGQALTIARPDFKDTHRYVLVLPLLHFSEPQDIPLEVLPKWMRSSKQLNQFSETCMSHFERSFNGMSFARMAAKQDDIAFSELNFYQSAGKKHRESVPHIAIDCMKRSATLLDDTPEDQIPVLQEIVQTWIDSGNYVLAASEAKNIITKYSDEPDSAEAYWLYFYALSRANNSQTILKEIDSALEKPQCKPYQAKMMYIKWWALRRERDQMPRVAALEHELLKLYPDNPMIAPILLSRATDLLASQDYNGAYEMLSQLAEKFPDTQAANQAQKILVKLKTLTNRG